MGKEENKIVFGIISIVLSSESAIITLSNLVEEAWWFTATFISWFSFVTVPMWTSLTTQVKGGLSRGLLLIWLSTGALTHPPWNLGSWEGRNVGGPEGCRSPISWRDRLVRFLVRSLFLVSQHIQALPCGLRCQRRAESNSQVWVLDEYVSEAPVQSVWAKNQDIRKECFPRISPFWGRWLQERKETDLYKPSHSGRKAVSIFTVIRPPSWCDVQAKSGLVWGLACW